MRWIPEKGGGRPAHEPRPKSLHGPADVASPLPDDSYGRLRPHIEVTRIPLAKTLVKVGEPIDRVYFLHDSIIAIVPVMKSGAVAEMSAVGRDGMTGTGNLWNRNIATGRQIVPPGVRRAAARRRPFGRGRAAGPRRHPLRSDAPVHSRIVPPVPSGKARSKLVATSS